MPAVRPSTSVRNRISNHTRGRVIELNRQGWLVDRSVYGILNSSTALPNVCLRAHVTRIVVKNDKYVTMQLPVLP